MYHLSDFFRIHVEYPRNFLFLDFNFYRKINKNKTLYCKFRDLFLARDLSAFL